mgnify:CR=1 FL=1
MELVHIDVLRIERHCQSDVFALKNVGSANRHPSNVTAHVAAYHFFVGMEAAGADDYTAFSHEVNGFIILIDGSAA